MADITPAKGSVASGSGAIIKDGDPNYSLASQNDVVRVVAHGGAWWTV